MKTIKERCPDCGSISGDPHKENCDIERCSECSGQRITCDCQNHDPLKSVWTGQWPLKKNIEASKALSEDARIDAQSKHCYKNAVTTIENCDEFSSATYVEGIAVDEGIEFEHGWIETEGEIIDPTLPTMSLIYFPGLRYEGEFDIQEALDIPKDWDCSDLPIFHRFLDNDWPQVSTFKAARDAAKRLSGHVIARQDSTQLRNLSKGAE